MAYISRLFGSFITLSLNGADPAGWFVNNPGYSYLSVSCEKHAAVVQREKASLTSLALLDKLGD